MFGIAFIAEGELAAEVVEEDGKVGTGIELCPMDILE
jgi:hypothetical protein